MYCATMHPHGCYAELPTHMVNVEHYLTTRVVFHTTVTKKKKKSNPRFFILCSDDLSRITLRLNHLEEALEDM